MNAPTPTFQERIDRMQVTLRAVGGFAGDPEPEDVAQECEMVAGVVSDLADLVGVLADLVGSRPASEVAAKLPSQGGVMQYRITAQNAADSQDPRGTQVFEGGNFSELVTSAQRQGYYRIIAGEQREVTPWTPITGYDFAEATP